jgi:hypothetical protein
VPFGRKETWRNSMAGRLSGESSMRDQTPSSIF